jgi:hypothetical protein
MRKSYRNRQTAWRGGRMHPTRIASGWFSKPRLGEDDCRVAISPVSDIVGRMATINASCNLRFIARALSLPSVV